MPEPEILTVQLDLLEFWHCGGDTKGLGAPVERDSSGLPFVSGRRLKGMLRDAVECCERLGQAPSGCAIRLFGGPVPDEGGAGGFRPASLRVSDARLPQGLRAWLAVPKNEACRRALFRELFFAEEATPKAGRDFRLRGLEVAVPVALEAEIALIGEASAVSDWAGIIATALPLAVAVGSHRSRGLGRCALYVREQT